jgi:hypothetical protein
MKLCIPKVGMARLNDTEKGVYHNVIIVEQLAFAILAFAVDMFPFHEP